MSDVKLDTDFCRSFFPPMSNGWTYFENAGGSYIPTQVIGRMNSYMQGSQCQLDWDFEPAKKASALVADSKQAVAEMLNCDVDEIIFGPSTTINVYVLAQGLRHLFKAGDEIVVTNQDHEANGGAWRRMVDMGVVIREWKVDPKTGDLNLDDLDALLNDETRLVCFPQVSNIVGSFNDVKAITKKAHAVGAWVCVDAVAAVAHWLPDVRELDVDFYLFSLYKLYGPHLGLMYGKRERIAACSNQNHFFHEGHPPATLNPGGMNYEAVASVGGIADYLDAVYAHHFSDPLNRRRDQHAKVFKLFAEQEERAARPLVDYITKHPKLRLVGRQTADHTARAATFSIIPLTMSPAELYDKLIAAKFCCGHGHFYGYRVVEAMGLDPEVGVLRLSLVHYNTEAEVARLIEVLDQILGD